MKTDMNIQSIQVNAILKCVAAISFLLITVGNDHLSSFMFIFLPYAAISLMDGSASISNLDLGSRSINYAVEISLLFMAIVATIALLFSGLTKARTIANNRISLICLGVLLIFCLLVWPMLTERNIPFFNPILFIFLAITGLTSYRLLK